MKVFTVINVNFDAMQDLSIGSTWSTLEEAFKDAIEDVVRVEGKDVKVHNYVIEGFQGLETVTTRLTNNNSLGSDYGISYRSSWGNYSCARMIIEREVKQAIKPISPVDLSTQSLESLIELKKQINITIEQSSPMTASDKAMYDQALAECDKWIPFREREREAQVSALEN